jgi:dihydropteroate synthase type 2
VRPTIFGIVNVTEDSFSDGGRHLDPDAALAHARRLVRDGADVIDLGPASSRPGATPVPAREEIRRIAGLIDALHADGIEVSIDSSQPETQRFGLAEGVAWLNDVRGFPDPALYEALAAHPTRLVVMHQVAGVAARERMPPAAVLASIDRFFDTRLRALESAGIARERLVLDPGMGLFLGSETEASVEVLRRLPALRRRFGLPLLVSVSRKSFLRRLTGRSLDEIAAATLGAELWLATQGVEYVRTHDPRQLGDALRVWERLAERS